MEGCLEGNITAAKKGGRGWNSMVVPINRFLSIATVQDII
jgi:hypothetical protein